MRVISYPKHPHPCQVSREVIEDTPEAWRALEAWWTKMVRSLAGHVDAWGVINEPMWRSWKGDNELIVRYWALMRRIVDQYDPDTPLIGPSLTPNRETYVSRYETLLDMGLGRYLDVVEMHTYITTPEGAWAGRGPGAPDGRPGRSRTAADRPIADAEPRDLGVAIRDAARHGPRPLSRRRRDAYLHRQAGGGMGGEYPAHPDRDRAGGGEGPSGLEHRARLQRRLRRRAPAGAASAAILARSAADRLSEIGRASGRERGGQSV